MITPIDPSADKYPDSKAVILYDNAFTVGREAITPNTYESLAATYFSGPDGDVYTIETGVESPSSITIDCMSALVNTQDATSVSIDFYLSSILVKSVTVGIVDGVIMTEFEPVNVDQVFISSAADFDVVYVAGGQCLKMTQPIYGGHAPITLSSNTKYDSAKSVSGNFIGRTIERQGGETQFNWRNLDPYWYRSTFQPFVEHAKSKPFFIKWRPDYHSDEASYCWTTQGVKPQNQGGGNQLMSVNMSVECYDGV